MLPGAGRHMSTAADGFTRTRLIFDTFVCILLEIYTTGGGVRLILDGVLVRTLLSDFVLTRAC